MSNHEFLNLVNTTIVSIVDEISEGSDIKNIDPSDIRTLSIKLCDTERILKNIVDDKEMNTNGEVMNTLAYLCNIQYLLMDIVNKNRKISMKTFLRKINEINYDGTFVYRKKEPLFEKIIAIFVAFSGGAFLYMIVKEIIK